MKKEKIMGRGCCMFLRKHVSFFIFLLCFLSLSGCLSGCSKSSSSQEGAQESIVTPSSATEEELFAVDPLTGKKVKRTVPLIAVMVDNLVASRPQTGLGEAGIVYEIEAEGTISRFMALYAGDPPQNVGPVRSGRTYFLNLVQEWGAYYAHVGGSEDALKNIRLWGINDMDDLRGDKGFWLDRTRKRPHNTYLNLEQALAGKEDTGIYKNWRFADPSSGPPDWRKISFRYSRDNLVTYRFSDEKKQYLRYINGIPHTDRVTGRQIAVTNVVLQYAPHYYRNDSLGHIDVDLIGEGKAEYFLAGKYYQGFWVKNGSRAPTRFYDADGNEISFVRGNTWIQVLRPGAEVIKE